MTERLTRVPRAVLEPRRSGVQIPGQPSLTQPCKRFATASTSTQVAVLSRRYDVEMDTANSLHASAYSNTASIMKGLVYHRLST